MDVVLNLIAESFRSEGAAPAETIGDKKQLIGGDVRKVGQNRRRSSLCLDVLEGAEALTETAVISEVFSQGVLAVELNCEEEEEEEGVC